MITRNQHSNDENNGKLNLWSSVKLPKIEWIISIDNILIE